MKRRTFVNLGAHAAAAVGILGLYACREEKKEKSGEEVGGTSPFFELSLAQWSLHRAIREGMDPYRFAEKAKELGFKGLEYVSQLYPDLKEAGYTEGAMQEFVRKCKQEARAHDMENVLIMVDGEGDLATPDAEARKSAVEDHYKWVDAAAGMGCHAIRVNLSGSTDEEEWVRNSAEGLRALCSYAGGKQISVLVENHGGLSSNASLLAEVMERVGMPNCGTLPDFGNFCIEREDPSDWGSDCVREYDIYRGVRELLPYAQAVSAKAYDFDQEGEETRIDFTRMLSMIKASGYRGYIGVEYEGDRLAEEAGIVATRDLLLRAAEQLS